MATHRLNSSALLQSIFKRFVIVCVFALIQTKMLSVHCLVKQIGSSKRSFLNLAVISQQQKLHSQPKWFSLSDETKTSLKNFTQIKNTPASALVYGVSGLIPFTAIPSFMYQTSMFVPELAYAQLAYSAVILSFLGGVRWGSSVSNPEVQQKF